MTLKRNEEDIKVLQEILYKTAKKETIDNSIEQLIKLQEGLEDSGGEKEKDSIKVLKDLQSSLEDSGKNEWIDRTLILTQILSLYGIAKISELIDANSNKFSEEFKLGINRIYLNHQANEIKENRVTPIQINKREDALSKFDSSGLNSLNRWRVDFIDNKTLSPYLNTFLSDSCKEVNLESFGFTMSKLDLVFSNNDDVSDIQVPTSCQFTFMHDRELMTKKIIEKVVNKMKNFRTGRYGYKEDYRWSKIKISIFDTMNVAQKIYFLHDCTISGLSELALSYNASEFQTFQVTFSFSWMETRILGE